VLGGAGAPAGPPCLRHCNEVRHGMHDGVSTTRVLHGGRSSVHGESYMAWVTACAYRMMLLMARACHGCRTPWPSRKAS
jgi:hypothetical protein